MLAIGLSTVVTGTAGAQTDVGPWTQFQGGAGHHGFLADGPQPPYRVRWTLPAPAGDALSPAIIVGGQAIAVGEAAVYGVDVGTGSVAWQLPRGGGPLSAPAVAPVDGREILLYLEGPLSAEGAASTSPTASAASSPTAIGSGATEASARPSPSAGSDGSQANPADASSLVAVRLRDHRELFRVPLGGTARSSVTVDDGNAYVGDQDGTVYAVSLADGSVRWTATVPGRVDTPVAVGDGNVYVVARNLEDLRVAIAAFDASTGEPTWPPMALQASSTAGSGPLAGEGSVVIGSSDRLVRALSATDGSQRWGSLVLSLFSPVTSPASASGSVFAADISGGLYRLDPADGSRRWSYQLNDVVLRGSPVVSGSTVLLGLGDGRLVAIDVASGHLVGQTETSPGALGAIALSNVVVVAVKGGERAGLIAFEHDPDGTLVDLPSPTELDALVTLSRYAAAAVLVFALAFGLGVLARRRFGGPVLAGGPIDGEGPGEEANEGVDAGEDDP